ncbi:MAG: LptE family protein [Nitrospira sp.]|nr:LPS assembly lipoprotein LptE [Nitrospira sp.]
MHPYLLPFGLCILALNFTACGYQFRVQGAGPTVGGAPEVSTKRPEAPRLAILPIANSTYEPNFEVKLTNYLRREFSSGGGAEIVGPSAGADLYMSGQIMQISLPTLSFDQTTTFESRVEMLVSVRIEDAKTKKPIWSQVSKGISEFFITQDLQFNQVLQNRAVEQAGRFIAEDLASRFLLFLDTGELDKALKRPVKTEAASPGNAQPAATR